MTTATTNDERDVPGPTDERRRISALDALRGFALCGIVFVNIPQTMDMLTSVGDAPTGVRYLVIGRFFPIFYLLFGIGFGIFLRSAARRSPHHRRMLVRRLVALGVLGAVHHLLQPGEVLLPFAITGLVVLLPASWLSARANLVLGSVLTVAGLVIGVGGFGVLPGLFVLGFALAGLGVHEQVATRTRQVVLTGLCLAVLSLLVWWAIVEGVLPYEVERRAGLLLQVAMSFAYACLLLAALATRAGPAVTTLLAPMGRMALTNYLTATVAFVALGPALGLRDSDAWSTVGWLGLGILVVQAVWSPLWLRAFRYGPLEWAWRCVTYWRVVPIRRHDGDTER